MATELTVRPAAVAGTFYPSKPRELDATVQYYLAEAASVLSGGTGPVPKAIIVPHAGFIYSGLTAAAAYLRLQPAAKTIKRVVMMGPCHRVAVEGLALSGADMFETPLGDIPIDKDAVQRVIDMPGVQIFDDTHKQDHALEVQLPFLQSVLDDFTIVPFIVGRASPEQVGNVLEALWGGDETLILISSDLSHYMTYDDARGLDDRTRIAIENMDSDALGDDQACGRHSIKGLFAAARQHGLTAETIDVRNSGDTAGSKDKVVGYGSWVFVESEASKTADDGANETQKLLQSHGENLLQAAAATITHGVKNSDQLMVNPANFPDILRQTGATFVTLNLDGKLRGCVGTIQAARPLIADVVDNAYRSAFKDRRFKPLTLEELASAEREISISVLSPQVAMSFTDEADLIGQMRPGIDGIVITDQGKRAVFLPVVWESLPDAKQFLLRLKQKAGLAENHWSASFQAFRFTSESIYSHQLPDPEALWKSLT